MSSKTIVLVAGALASLSAMAALERATPESQGISSRAISAWIDRVEKEVKYLHSFVIVRHGKIVSEGWWAPYRKDLPHRLFSHSKSFTSTAIGLAVDEGKLDLDERVAEIFPEKMPASPNENLRSLRVRDLLTMNAGSAPDRFRTNPRSDWMREYLAGDFSKRPGTAFKYDSSSTYMLAEVVQRKTGRPMMDYLEEKFFGPVGITDVVTTVSPSGCPCGGWGMAMKTEDLVRFGLVYLNGGVWEGRQILSRDWVRLATAKQTWSGWSDKPEARPESDWHQGYGFQFWRCRFNAFRADGAGGQFTLMLPDQDAVISCTALFGDYQGAFNTIWEGLLAAMQEGALPENAEAAAALEKRCSSLTLPVVAGETVGAVRAKTTWNLKPNAAGYKTLTFEPESNGWRITLAAPGTSRAYAIGYGEWRKGEVTAANEAYDPLGAFGLLGNQEIATSGAWTSPTVFEMKTWFVREAEEGSLKIDFATGKPKATYVENGACVKTVTLELEAE